MSSPIHLQTFTAPTRGGVMYLKGVENKHTVNGHRHKAICRTKDDDEIDWCTIIPAIGEIPGC